MAQFDPYYVAAAWEKTGGSFVKALGAALFRADAENAQKIMETFSNYVDSYESRIRELMEEDRLNPGSV